MNKLMSSNYYDIENKLLQINDGLKIVYYFQSLP